MEKYLYIYSRCSIKSLISLERLKAFCVTHQKQIIMQLMRPKLNGSCVVGVGVCVCVNILNLVPIELNTECHWPAMQQHSIARIYLDFACSWHANKCDCVLITSTDANRYTQCARVRIPRKETKQRIVSWTAGRLNVTTRKRLKRKLKWIMWLSRTDRIYVAHNDETLSLATVNIVHILLLLLLLFVRIWMLQRLIETLSRTLFSFN